MQISRRDHASCSRTACPRAHPFAKLLSANFAAGPPVHLEHPVASISFDVLAHIAASLDNLTSPQDYPSESNRSCPTPPSPHSPPASPRAFDALVQSFADVLHFIWDHPRASRTATQLPQSGYAPLLSPYLVFGLG
eukprot:2396107-Pleurochrysis_carterae.AAC.1